MKTFFAWLRQIITTINTKAKSTWQDLGPQTQKLALIGAGLLTITGFLAGLGIGQQIGRPTLAPSPTSQAEGLNFVPAKGIFGQIRSLNAPRANGEKPLQFDIWRHHIDTSNSEPSVCVEFSRPLDTSKNYNDYVLISPALGTPPALVVKDDQLCVRGLGLDERRLTLLKGLPGDKGQKLPDNRDIDFKKAEMPPYVGFTGSGVILPREDADGLAIETVNVSKLAIEVWHINDKNLIQKAVSAPAAVAEGDYDGDWGEDSINDLGVKIWTGEMPVKTTQGQRVTTIFPLAATLKSLRSGAYVVKVRDFSAGNSEDDRPARARRWVLLTDMAMTTYKGAEGLDTVVRSLKSARPLPMVRINLMAVNGDVLGEGRTDGQGRVHFPNPLLAGQGALAPKMIMAHGSNDDFTATDINRSPLDLSKNAVGGRHETGLLEGRNGGVGVDGYLYTDRGIYRPGEMVRLVALVRDTMGRAIKDRRGALVVTRPSGIEAYRLKFDKTPDGFASGDIALPKTAPRGQWNARLEIEGLDAPAGSITFAVEDFAPQRLGVDIKADPLKPLLSADETRPFTVQARFLYGAAASGLNVSSEARFKVDGLPFPAYKDYQFGDTIKPYEETYAELESGQTDATGQTTLPFKASLAGVSTQPLSALVTTSVFEPGGRPVRESTTMRLRTQRYYIGINTEDLSTSWRETPKTRFNIIGLSSAGQIARMEGARIKLIAEHWDYDWYIDNGQWKWRSTHRDSIVSETIVTLDSKPYQFEKALDWGDYRIEIEHPATKTVSKLRFSSGWGSPKDQSDSPDMVRINALRSDYAQGDTIEIKLQPPFAGEVQVAVATDRLIDLVSASVPEKGTTLKLKTDSQWGGGAYLLISVIQPRDPVKSAKPRRAIGVIYVPLNPKERILTVSMPVGTAPLQAKSEGLEAYVEVPLEVKGLKLGQSAKISLSVVDQGILNLTKFASPDPRDHYFGKRALSLDMADDYGRLLNPNLGAAQAVNFGGDQLGGEGLSVTPIKTTAIWNGVFKTGLDGKAFAKIPLSRFSGELRLMAVAWTDEAVGSGSEKMVVREPVVADLALPRFLSPGDKAFATVDLDNVAAKEGGFTITLKGLMAQGQHILVNIKKSLTLLRNQRQTDSFEINAPTRSGIGSIELALSGQGFSTTHTYPLQTRLGWGPQTRIIVEKQEAGQTFKPDASLISGLAPGTARVEISYSPLRGIDPGPISVTLSRYPYGCTEQITSAATPWLYVTEDLVGKSSAQPARSALNGAVAKLMDRQGIDGAFGLWRVGDRDADGFIGAFVTDFLVEARAKGVIVSKDGLDRALNAMRELSKPKGFHSVDYRLSIDESWGYSAAYAENRSKMLSSRAQAYALYVLAKAGSGDISRLRWYHDVMIKSEKSPLARAQIAAGLARLGDKARARSAFKSAIDALGYEDQDDWYQTPLRDLAGVMALAYEAGEMEIGDALTPRLERAMREPDNLNTQEKAFILKAAAARLARTGAPSLDTKGVRTQGMIYGVENFSGASITNRSKGALWRTVTISGLPVSAPSAIANGLRINREHYAMDGTRLDVSKLTQGQKFITVISIQSDQAQLRPIIVDEALSAGIEIETTLSSQDSQSGAFGFMGAISPADAQESRDDRYIASLKVKAGQTYRLAFVGRAVTAGSFNHPGTEARDFYRPSVMARLSGSQMSIKAR
jgi:uncharacterized protein YfaS (alpha-2-macroglobulin family)